MKVVYVAHALGSGPDREQNRANAAKWGAWVATQGHAPVADWIWLSGEFAETPAARARGLACDLALVARCDEVWLVGGRVTPGMREEAAEAERHGVTVVDMTGLGPLPPVVAP